jgi:hypothetical protein
LAALRELKVQRANRYQISALKVFRWKSAQQGELYYGLSRNGKSYVMFARDLKKLKLVDYDMPVVNR